MRQSQVLTKLFPVLVAGLLSAPASAQILRPQQPSFADQWTISGSFMGGLPVGEFRDYENGGFGGEFTLGIQPFRRQPLLLRFSGGGLQYGAAKAWGYEEVCGDDGCWVEEVEYNARSHSLWYAQVGPEVMVTDGRIRPFAFAMIGSTFFSSRANIKPTIPGGREDSFGLFSSHNYSTSYGGGLRTMLATEGREIGVELSGRVMRNINAEYLNENGVVVNPDGSYSVTPRRGPANVLGIYLGIWVGPRVLWSER